MSIPSDSLPAGKEDLDVGQVADCSLSEAEMSPPRIRHPRDDLNQVEQILAELLQWQKINP